MRILVTRPEPDATRTAARLADMGHEALVDPLLIFERVENPALPSGEFDAVAVTSANAMRAAGGLGALRELFAVPAFAVGARTAEAVRAAGFERVAHAQGDAVDLARLLTERLKPGARVLHLAGEHRAKEFPALLAPAGIEAATLVLYRMRAATRLAPATVAAVEQERLQAVLHYSPRSAALFVTLMQQAGLAGRIAGLRHFCLSQAVAAPLVAAGAAAEAAARLDENALLAMIQR